MQPGMLTLFQMVMALMMLIYLQPITVWQNINIYFNGLPNVTTVNSFPYTVDFVNGLITDGGWSGNFIERGTESRTNYAARFIYNYLFRLHSSIKLSVILSPLR